MKKLGNVQHLARLFRRKLDLRYRHAWKPERTSQYPARFCEIIQSNVCFMALILFLSQAGLFSAIVSAFIAQSAGNLQPDYEKLSALLSFDQINIQLALASGISPDRITTSGTDPTTQFTPDPLDSWVNGLWFSSLTLSLATALFAVLADGWYCHYLSPVAGNPQVRARTRHLR